MQKFSFLSDHVNYKILKCYYGIFNNNKKKMSLPSSLTDFMLKSVHVCVCVSWSNCLFGWTQKYRNKYYWEASIIIHQTRFIFRHPLSTSIILHKPWLGFNILHQLPSASYFAILFHPPSGSMILRLNQLHLQSISTHQKKFPWHTILSLSQTLGWIPQYLRHWTLLWPHTLSGRKINK